MPTGPYRRVINDLAACGSISVDAMAGFLVFRGMYELKQHKTTRWFYNVSITMNFNIVPEHNL